MTTGEAVNEVVLNCRFNEFHTWTGRTQLDRKTTTELPRRRIALRTPSEKTRPSLPTPVTLHYPPFTKFLAPRNTLKSGTQNNITAL